MSLSQETLIELMALADGELEGADLARVEQLVAGSDEARRTVEAMRSPALGAWLRDEMDERSAAADGIADAVMAQLEAAPAGDGDGGVVRLADARARKGSRARIAYAAAALALAAGFVGLYLRAGHPDSEVQAPVASVGNPSVDLQLPPVAPQSLAQRPSQGVEVDEVDSPSRGISVFEIPVAGAAAAANAVGPSSVVIMIEDDPGAK